VALCKDPKTGKIESIPGNSCPAGWATISTGTVPAEEIQVSTSGNSSVPSTADSRPVMINYAGTTQKYGSPRPVFSNVYQQQQNLASIRATNAPQYKAIVELMRRRGYLGPRTNSIDAINNAWRELNKDAAASLEAGDSTLVKTPTDLLIGDRGGEDIPVGPRGGSGSRAYTGPVQSVTVQAESDVRATADTVAMEMLGRGVSDEEFQRILNRTRKAEQAQPQVTTSATGMSTTQQGLTAEGRQDIVQNIIAKKPEYQEFQKATTLMSWFDRALNERMQ
jgi:hypothetical protein